MNNNSFGKRTYVRTLASDIDPGDSGGVMENSDGANAQRGGRSNMVAQARLQGRELQMEAARKKFHFQQKMNLEGNRKMLGKGNIITFLVNESRQGIELNEVNKILRVGGFKPDQVVTLKLNDFRTNQIEVLFKKDVQVDIEKVEEKLRKDNLDVIVSKFDHLEEFLMVYGLPPSNNMEDLKEKLYEAVAPFVKKVIEISPGLHRGLSEDDFFAGKYNGNWRIKVIPKQKVYIPNFIVIGDGVMGKAVYTKRLGDKSDMCTECYREGHYRKDCPGSRAWSDYCVEFREIWEKLLNEVWDTDDSEEVLSEDSSSILAKLAKSEKEKKELHRRHEREQKELTDQVKKQNVSIEEMRRMKEFSERQVETLNKKLMEADERFQCLKTDLCKQMDLIKGGVDMDMLQEVNVRDKEIAELIKRCELAEAAVQENEDLKGKVQRLEEDRA